MKSAEVEPHEILLFKRACVLVLLNRNEEALVASDAALVLKQALALNPSLNDRSTRWMWS